MTRQRNIRTAAFAAGLLAMVGSTSALATTAVWNTSNVAPTDWTRGAAGSIYGEWNVFSDDNGSAQYIVDSTPDVGSYGSSFTLQEWSNTAFLTSGGNIYSFSAPVALTLQAIGSSDAGTRDVELRIASVGTLYDAASFTLNGAAYTNFTELFTETGSFAGSTSYEKEWLFTWNNVANAAAFVFAFNALGSSASLDQLAVDFSPVNTAPVPLPPAAWLLGSALCAMTGIGRRRRASAA